LAQKACSCEDLTNNCRMPTLTLEFILQTPMCRTPLGWIGLDCHEVQYKNNIYTIRSDENDSSSPVHPDNSTETQHTSGAQSKNNSRLKKHMIAAIFYLALSINALIVFLLVPNKYTSDSSPTPANTSTNTLTNVSTDKSNELIADALVASIPQPLQRQLKNKTLNVMQSDDWDVQKLKHIDMDWQRLSRDQQSSTKQEVWFQLFENALVNQLSMQKNSTDNTTKITSTRLALIRLANSIDIRDISKYLPETSNGKNIANQVKTGIDPTPKSSHEPLKTNRKITETLAQKQISQPQIQPQLQPQLPPYKKRITRVRPDGPTLSELRDITVKFIDSYEQGDLEKMMSLFSTKAISNRFNNIKEIRQDYANLFKSTSERQIFIHDIKWTYNKGRAVGKGKMATLLMTDTDTNVISRNSRVQIVVEKLGKSSRITRFYELVN